MGGTDLADTHDMGNLLLICGTGVSGCHGWIENDERGLAEGMGLWFRHITDDDRVPVPAHRVPVRIGGGVWRLLDPVVALYVDLPLSVRWSKTMQVADGDF